MKSIQWLKRFHKKHYVNVGNIVKEFEVLDISLVLDGGKEA